MPMLKKIVLLCLIISSMIGLSVPLGALNYNQIKGLHSPEHPLRSPVVGAAFDTSNFYKNLILFGNPSDPLVNFAQELIATDGVHFLASTSKSRIASYITPALIGKLLLYLERSIEGKDIATVQRELHGMIDEGIEFADKRTAAEVKKEASIKEIAELKAHKSELAARYKKYGTQLKGINVQLKQLRESPKKNPQKIKDALDMQGVTEFALKKIKAALEAAGEKLDHKEREASNNYLKPDALEKLCTLFGEALKICGYFGSQGQEYPRYYPHALLLTLLWKKCATPEAMDSYLVAAELPEHRDFKVYEAAENETSARKLVSADDNPLDNCITHYEELVLVATMRNLMKTYDL